MSNKNNKKTKGFVDDTLEEMSKIEEIKNLQIELKNLKTQNDALRKQKEQIQEECSGLNYHKENLSFELKQCLERGHNYRLKIKELETDLEFLNKENQEKMSSKKNQTKENLTIESLPKELKDRIVTVGITNSFGASGINSNANSTALFPNNTTAIAHEPFAGDANGGVVNTPFLNKKKMLPTNLKTIPIDAPKKVDSKKVKEDISIQVNYGENSPSIKKQLTAQGFKFNKELIKGCEAIRIDLLDLADIDILTKKQVLKAFAKLNTVISENVIQTTFGKDVKSVLKSTIANGKEI